MAGAWHVMCEIMQTKDSEVSRGQKDERLVGRGKDLGFHPKGNGETFGAFERDGGISIDILRRAFWPPCEE